MRKRIDNGMTIVRDICQLILHAVSTDTTADP